MRKGQAAMEFLMTYGWAILVVLAAIGALAYFGVLSPSKFLPEKCSFPAGMDCLGKASISAAGNNVSFVVGNNNGAIINVTGVTMSQSGTCGTTQLVIGNIAICSADSVPCTQGTLTTSGNISNNNGKIMITVTCNANALTGKSGQKFKDTFIVSYTNQDTGLSQKASGDVIGTIST